jgi:hypothetical protein
VNDVSEPAGAADPRLCREFTKRPIGDAPYPEGDLLGNFTIRRLELSTLSDADDGRRCEERHERSTEEKATR